MIIDTNNRSCTVTHPAYGSRTVNFFNAKDVDQINVNLATISME